MDHFEQVKAAIRHIDRHLGGNVGLEALAGRFGFSPWYFHRLFSLVVGMPVAAYVRARRLAHAAALLAGGGQTVLEIALDCGFGSAQAFSRAFAKQYGMAPGAYRRQNSAPDIPPAEELIKKFTNRLRGGAELKPKIIRQGILRVAGVTGDGGKTLEAWNAYEALETKQPLENRLSGDGYEIRMVDGNSHTVHVGARVKRGKVAAPYALVELPAAQYAVFDVYVADGYDSQNDAMNEWLANNAEGYRERLLDGAHYVVEFYDARFNGDEAGSIVEIWVPVQQ